MSLQTLVAEAQALVGEDPCAHGHKWEMVGGRVCQVHGDGCSEPVHQCLRCKEYDYEHWEGECLTEHWG